jgi:hypothetical protein
MKLIRTKKKNEMVICVDFDGTCVTHEFPKVGKDIGAAQVLKELVEAGNQLVLFTMRSNRPNGNFLDDAVNWFKDNEIELYGIQENPTQKNWTTSPKAYGEIYIDDAALGAPLIYPGNGEKPYVDWNKAREVLVEIGALNSKNDSI